MTHAYPLAWPAGWPRSRQRKTGRFATTRQSLIGRSAAPISVAVATERLLYELERIEARSPVISSGVALRRDGLPRSDVQPLGGDPGVAVYWTTPNGGRSVIAIDIYTTVADNLAAIAATLEAIRSIERHGGAQVGERAFTGFAAIAPPATWAKILGVPPTASENEINAAFRRQAAQHHPDVAGGSRAKFAELSAARDEALKERAGL